MKNGPIFFLGLFTAAAVTWGGIVLGSHAQLGSLTPYFDENENQSFPLRTGGIAARGQMVYADLGCAACHTQQVRRPDFGSDQARGWGERQSVARDYVHQARPQLGAMRIGPDLANVGGRKTPLNAEALANFLYSGSASHPAYKFLFEAREISGEPANNALRLTGPDAPVAGHEIVPTERARSLIAYLQSLNQGYAYPEARPVAPKSVEKKAAPAPGGQTVTPIPAAAPDEKKKQEGKK